MFAKQKRTELPDNNYFCLSALCLTTGSLNNSSGKCLGHLRIPNFLHAFFSTLTLTLSLLAASFCRRCNTECTHAIVISRVGIPLRGATVMVPGFFERTNKRHHHHHHCVLPWGDKFSDVLFAFFSCCRFHLLDAEADIL